MAVTRKFDDVMVVQLEKNPMGLIIRKIAEDGQVSVAEVCRQVFAKGLPLLADYTDAAVAVREGWTPEREMSSNSPAA